MWGESPDKGWRGDLGKPGSCSSSSDCATVDFRAELNGPRLGQHEEPDEDGVVVDVTGARWSWYGHAVGEPITGTIERAKAEAYKFWY